MSYAYVGCSILLMVYCQLALKWRVAAAGALPAGAADKARFLAGLLLDPWIVSALAAALLAAMLWMAALTKLDLSHAYPFVSLSFVLVTIASALMFHEPLTAPPSQPVTFSGSRPPDPPSR